MAPMNYRVPRSRGANAVTANPQAMGTKADARWATGRNVKRQLPDRKYDVVVAWTLKRRTADGKVETVRAGVTKEAAEEFIRGEGTFAGLLGAGR